MSEELHGYAYEVEKLTGSDDYAVSFYFACPICNEAAVERDIIFTEEEVEDIRSNGTTFDIYCPRCDHEWQDVQFLADMEN